ncbi:hypothetical protein [Limnochorda pilosa]|uniref:Uncharacterized protein n=1 Tax=Limnochorda pilosa TaxID=1555112 RepID=A0A0K2SJF6_LIMPI|nr:hypothetical protein [Limnochorda pilosa]BAS27238.1 hypothetical protein LIP_1387 [Limnochorda pilosa]
MLTRLFHELSGLVTRLLRYAAVILGAGSGTPLRRVREPVVVVVGVLGVGGTVPIRIRRWVPAITVIAITVAIAVVATAAIISTAATIISTAATIISTAATIISTAATIVAAATSTVVEALVKAEGMNGLSSGRRHRSRHDEQDYNQQQEM